MKYLTGNPLGSTDVRDLLDNAIGLDDALNDVVNDTWTDRFGRVRKTLKGYDAEFEADQAARAAAFQAFLDASGWSSLGAYAAGISIVSHTQTVDYLGQPYQLKPSVPASVDAPYVTTGNWATEGANFKLVGDNSLRQDLQLPGGASVVNGAMQYAANYAAIRALPFAKIKAVTALGCLSTGDGGSGIFYPDPSDTTSVDNGGSVLVTSDGGRLKLVQATPHRLSQFSAVCDGVANDSVAMQKLIDANKGKKVIIDKGTPMIGGVTLIGSTYDRTEIHCAGGVLKLAPDGGVASFGGAWVGLLFKDCSNNKADIVFDGNAGAMTQTREQIFCMGHAGSINFQSDCLTFNNIAGDGLYISQSDWQANSAATKNMSITKVVGRNATDRGRNAVSVVGVEGLTIGIVDSVGVGGLIGAIRQPGGIDIEPNVGYQKCLDISIGEVRVVTAGTSGLAILGKSVTSDAVGDWNIQRVTVGSFTVTIIGGSTGGVAVNKAFDVTLNGQIVKPTGAGGPCISIANISRIKGAIKTQGATHGAVLGAIGGTVTDFELDMFVTGFSVSGLRTGALVRGKFTGRAGVSSAAGSYGVQCHTGGGAGAGAVQQSVVYEVDIPYDGNMVRAFRNEPGNSVSFANSYVRGCDWSGYANPSVTNDALIPCENVRGYNDQLVRPESGAWVAGMTVKPRAFTVAGGKILTGWARLTTGSGNVAGTDWAPMYVTTT